MSVEKINDVGGFARINSDSINYTVVIKTSLNLIDSLELRGLYISLLSLPPDWVIRKTQIGAAFGIGEKKIDRYFAKLKKLGLLTITQHRDKNGHFGDIDYRIHVLPIPASSTGGAETVPTVTVPTDMTAYKVIKNTKEKKQKLKSSSSSCYSSHTLSSSSSPNVDGASALKCFQENFEDYNKKTEQLKKEPTRIQAIFLLAMINVKAGRHFRYCPEHIKMIEARLNSGVSLIDAKRIINHKVKEWGHRPEMAVYLRPATLFARTNFENYLGEFDNSTTQNQKGENHELYL